MKSISKQVRALVYNQAQCSSIVGIGHDDWSQVYDQVQDQIFTQVYSQIWRQVQQRILYKVNETRI